MRKLAIAAFSFSAAIFAANFIFTRDTVLYAALICALAGAAVLGIRLRSLRGVVIAAFAASIGFAVFVMHYDLTVSKAHRLSGTEDTYSFALLENPRKHRDYTSVEARLISEGRPRLKCVLYGSGGNLEGLSGGDLITARTKPSAADMRYGVHTDRYTAKDIYLTATLQGEVVVSGRQSSVSSLFSAAADRIADRMDRIFDHRTAPFVKALILGDKNDLYENDALYVSLSRAGLMHVVAVSGMHVSILIAFLRFLFGKGRRSALVCILLVWAFVALSGMSPSAVRAAFMQTMLLLAPLFDRENDPLTSLSAALALLLLANPFAAASISLQLSFAAMLGIVLLFERLQALLMRPFGEGRAADILRAPLAILACSLSVSAFTLPITAAYFGYVSVLAPLTNLLCLWAVPICFIGAFAANFLSWIPVIGKLLVFAVTWLVRYLGAVCGLISSWDASVIYLPAKLQALWIGLFYLSLALVFLFRLKPGLKLAIPLAAAILGILLCHAGVKVHYASARATMTAVDVGQGQCVSIMCGDSSVVIDCGSTSYAEYDAGDCAAAYLRGCGQRNIDALVFTHLHADHANGFERLSNLMPIERVLIAADSDVTDPALWEILACAQSHGTEVEFIEQNTLRRYGEIRLALFPDKGQGDENEKCMTLIASVDDYDMIVTGDAPASREMLLAENASLSGVDALIVGHHGSKSSSCEEYLAAISGEKAIISVGENRYGLPAPEVLERLAEFGYTVYRTDRDGSVEIRIDG